MVGSGVIVSSVGAQAPTVDYENRPLKLWLLSLNPLAGGGVDDELKITVSYTIDPV